MSTIKVSVMALFLTSFTALCSPSETKLLAESPATYPSSALMPIPADDYQLDGYLGRRLDANRTGILLDKDEGALLAPFRERGNKDQSWIGEHVGKWLSAAAIACRHAPDDKVLREKLVRVADELIATQEPDGYLGTYVESDRWTSWDVWVLKYNLLGLLDTYDTTGDQRYLKACRGIVDLLAETFGPDKRDILKSGTHKGMAPASVLQPVMLLYERTREPRYRDFAAYLVDALQREGGPMIVPDLMKGTPVHKVANAKAYEMLSDILGLLEAYKAGLCPDGLAAAEEAAADILAHRLYITGGSTYGEYFQESGHLPNVGHVGETCVTMSLLQLYDELLRLTGKAEYAHAAEHLIHNHLLACQHPDGKSVCYYTPLRGHKFFFTFLGCCISSGQRALAMIPETAYLQADNRLVVNHLGAATLDTTLDSGQHVTLVQKSDYPWEDQISFDVKVEGQSSITLAIRIPPYAENATLLDTLKNKTYSVESGCWHEKEVAPGSKRFILLLDFPWQMHRGGGENSGYLALQFGPVVFAYDFRANREIPHAFYPAFEDDLGTLAPKLSMEDGQAVMEVNGYTPSSSAFQFGGYDPHAAPPASWSKRRLRLLPFTDAGTEDYFTVWLPIRSDRINPQRSLFTYVHQKQSREGRHMGSLVDNDASTFATTDDGRRAETDFFEVNCGWHTKYNVIVFRHGKTFENGGWFDTSSGKPVIQAGSYGRYKEIGRLDAYPATTATDPGTLKDGQAFRFVIPKDLRTAEHAIRVTGIPSHGNDPARNFSSCANIEVYYDPTLEVE